MYDLLVHGGGLIWRGDAVTTGHVSATKDDPKGPKSDYHARFPFYTTGTSYIGRTKVKMKVR